ncbi:MAG TPA: hypothetical protein VH590_16630, partial [Ktedonobacterales bacterium]
MRFQERPQGYAAGVSDPEAAVNSNTPQQAEGVYRLGLVYGRLVYRFRWFIIAFWLIALAVSVPFAATVADVLNGGGGSSGTSESTQASNLLKSRLHEPATQLLVVFQSATTPVTDPAYQQEVSAFINRARGFPSVSSVISGGVGKDGRTTYVDVN